MFGGSSGIFGDGRAQFSNGGRIVALGHVGAGQAVMTTFPVGVAFVEVLKFVEGAIEIFFVAENVSQVAANAGLIGLETLRGSIFRYCLIELALVVQDDAQIAVGLPEIGAQGEGVAIGDSGAAQVSLVALGDPHIEVDIGVGGGVGGFTGECFPEGVERSIVITVGIKS